MCAMLHQRLYLRHLVSPSAVNNRCFYTTRISELYHQRGLKREEVTYCTARRGEDSCAAGLVGLVVSVPRPEIALATNSF